MGEHKRNPTAIAASKVALPPKKKSKLSKRQREAELTRKLWEIIRLPKYY